MLFDACKDLLNDINIKLFNNEREPVSFSDEALKKVLRKKKFRKILRLSDDEIVEIVTDKGDAQLILASFVKEVHDLTIELHREELIEQGYVKKALVKGKGKYIITDKGYLLLDEMKNEEDMDNDT